MEVFELWKTPIVRINVADRFNMADWTDEVFALYSMTGGEDSRQRCIDKDLFPVILSMRDEVITPAVKQFCLDHFNYKVGNFYVDTNGKWIVEGEGLYPHYHPGSVVSAICYPGDSVNGMTMFDPKGNACRGYPKPMRNSALFKNFTLQPKQGDIYLFPSYVQHSVAHVTEDLRLSLLHEYYIIEDL